MAAGRIRGITLEINGDATGLADALKGVNSQIKGTQTTLRDVDKLLKLDPSNTELLAQKQKLLTQAVESTREKLQTLKKASEEAAKSSENYEAWKEKYEPLRQQIEETSGTLKDLRQKAAEAREQFEGGKISEEQYKAVQTELAETSAKLRDLKKKKKAVDDEFGNPVSPEQYDALQREIIETEQDLKKLEDAANDTGGEIDDLDKSTDEISVSLGDMVKNKVVDLVGDAFINLGQKAVEAAKYCVEVGSSFEAAMSEVEAISGASSGEMDRLAAKAKEMGATTKFSASEAAEAMNYMAMAGWKTEDMISGIDGIMNLAAASGEDLATTSDIVTDALTAFGESADQSGRLADIMAAASSNANTNVGMMGETFRYAAPVAGALGYKMEDTAVAIGLMANAGIKASQAGTSIRSGLTRLAAPTKQVSEAMDKYGISLTDADGKMLSFRELMVQLREKLGGLSEVEQTAAASALFGKNAMSGWLAVINGSDEDFDKLTNAIDNSSGSASKMAETMQDNLAGKLTILNSALEGLGIAVYNYVSGPLQSVVEFVTGVIGGITGLLTPQRTELENFIDDIREANDQVQQSLDHAQKTVEGGDAKAAEIEAYKGMLDGILDSCEEFNLVTLDNGEQAIVDSSGNVVQSFEGIDTSAQTTEEILDQWAAGGFNTAGIKDSSEEAKTLIGYVSDSVDTVESRLDSFASSGINTEGVEAGKTALVQIFDDIGQEIVGYETGIDEAGNVVLDTAGIESGTSLAVTYFNEASGKVETFKTDLENLSGSQVNLSQVAEQFSKVEDSVKRTYVITDEFTKTKISNMVDALGSSVEGLADAWNAQTGELTASKEELEKWFDTAKEVAVYEALQDALKEMYDAWGQAAVNVAKAESATNAALEELNKTAGTHFKTVQEVVDYTGDEINAYSDLVDAVADASDEQAEANTIMAEAEDAINTTGASLSEMKDKVGDLLAPTEEAGVTAEDAAQAVSDLGDESEEAADQVEKLTDKQQEAITSLGELYGATQEDLAWIQTALGMSGSDFAEWAQGILDTNEEIEKSFLDLHGKLVDEMTAMSFDLTGDGSPLDNLEKNLQERNEKLRSWVVNMQELMAQLEAGNLNQDVYDAIVDMGPEKGAEAAAAFADGFRTGNYEQINRIQGEFATQMDLSQNAYMIASATTTGQAYANNLATHTVDNLRALANDTIAEAGVAAGQAASDSIAQGVTNEAPLIEEALDNSVIDATDSATTEAENASETGETMATSTKEGIESTKQEVADATEGMISDARDTAETIASEFHKLGQDIPQKVKQGIKEAENAFLAATSGFTWTLPRPQIPHISWDWTNITYGDGGSFSIPNFSVEWYAKAMKRGMILDRPTIFGSMDGRLLAGGEAGPEAVVGTRSLMGMIQQAVSQAQASNVNNFGGVTINVYGHEGQDIRQLADEIEYRIALNVKRRGGGFV